ncbi:MAG: Rpn family recombination-promoting nuclease/putative transposase [Treponema sp.]|nr:Rpn family recombination-promoting nuclease/putative transposase [Treponema sp.]
MKIKRNYKDSVFTTLFNDPALLRELYCALEGVTLPPDTPVSINTLENVLYMDIYNDISFEIGGKLVVLVEHQSTIGANLALRLLLYYTRVLEKSIDSRILYSEKRITIPWPEFYVLYNGIKPFPDTDVMRLSDLFDKPQDLGLPEKVTPLLDLEVKIININEGRNGVIVDRCRELSDYSKFIASIRAFFDELGNKEDAVKEAVKYCQKHGILKRFLEIYGSEVLNMLLAEWNIDDALAVAREEGMEQGLEQGREQGLEQGREEACGIIAGKDEEITRLRAQLANTN